MKGMNYFQYGSDGREYLPSPSLRTAPHLRRSDDSERHLTSLKC